MGQVGRQSSSAVVKGSQDWVESIESVRSAGSRKGQRTWWQRVWGGWSTLLARHGTASAWRQPSCPLRGATSPARTPPATGTRPDSASRAPRRAPANAAARSATTQHSVASAPSHAPRARALPSCLATVRRRLGHLLQSRLAWSQPRSRRPRHRRSQRRMAAAVTRRLLRSPWLRRARACAVRRRCFACRCRSQPR